MKTLFETSVDNITHQFFIHSDGCLYRRIKQMRAVSSVVCHIPFVVLGRIDHDLVIEATINNTKKKLLVPHTHFDRRYLQNNHSPLLELKPLKDFKTSMDFIFSDISQFPVLNTNTIIGFSSNGWGGEGSDFVSKEFWTTSFDKKSNANPLLVLEKDNWGQVLLNIRSIILSRSCVFNFIGDDQQHAFLLKLLNATAGRCVDEVKSPNPKTRAFAMELKKNHQWITPVFDFNELKGRSYHLESWIDEHKTIGLFTYDKLGMTPGRAGKRWRTLVGQITTIELPVLPTSKQQDEMIKSFKHHCPINDLNFQNIKIDKKVKVKT